MNRNKVEMVLAAPILADKVGFMELTLDISNVYIALAYKTTYREKKKNP